MVRNQRIRKNKKQKLTIQLRRNELLDLFEWRRPRRSNKANDMIIITLVRHDDWMQLLRGKVRTWKKTNGAVRDKA